MVGTLVVVSKHLVILSLVYFVLHYDGMLLPRQNGNLVLQLMLMLLMMMILMMLFSQINMFMDGIALLIGSKLSSCDVALLIETEINKFFFLHDSHHPKKLLFNTYFSVSTLSLSRRCRPLFCRPRCLKHATDC